MTPAADPVVGSPARLPWVVRLVYPLRVLGFIITMMVLVSSLYDRTLPTLMWIFIVGHCLLWPQAAYLYSRTHRDPKSAELRNLVADCGFAGFNSVVVSFSLFPATFMLISTLFDALSIGGPRLAVRGLVAAMVTMLLGLAVLGFHPIIETNLAGSLTSMLGLFVFIGFVSTYNYGANRSFRKARSALEQNAVELHQTVADLQRARLDADAANRAKSQFLASMSHELRTPMNAVIGFSDLLLRSEQDPHRLEQLRHISSASRSLLALINQILDLSKIEAGKLEVERRAFAPAPLLDKLEAFFGSQAAGVGLELSVDRGQDLPLALFGDPLRLEQVLMNLVGNALKFTHHGRITVGVRALSRSAENVTLEFRVKDSGIGMSEDQLARLFTPFTQADQSTTRKYGGTGLGLVISKQLIELMRGSLKVDSQPGQGSEFCFALPFDTAQVSELPVEDDHMRVALGQLEGSSRLRGRRVLLVEDNDINRRLAAEILRDTGVVLDMAEDGRKAIAAVQDRTYDTVLMDVQMPVMDGLDATRAIRRLGGREHLPIIAMTANAMEQDREACLAAGMNDFLAKPIDAVQLLTTLTKWTPHA